MLRVTLPHGPICLPPMAGSGSSLVGSKFSWTHSQRVENGNALLMYCTDVRSRISVCLVAGAACLIFAVPLGPWGVASRQRTELEGAVAGFGYITLTMTINAPQLLLSILCFTLNKVCTSSATA